MNNLIIAEKNLKEISTAELKEALANSLEMTAQHLVLLGRIWVELESRGEDLSALRSGVGLYLSQIGSGKLSAKAVVAFAGQQLLLRELAELPIEEQERLADGGKVPLVIEHRTSKELKVDYVELSMLHSRHYSQVFNKGLIRNADEQKGLLQAPTTRKKKPAIPRKRKITVIKDENLVQVGALKLRLDDVVQSLKQAGISV